MPVIISEVSIQAGVGGGALVSATLGSVALRSEVSTQKHGCAGALWLNTHSPAGVSGAGTFP